MVANWFGKRGCSHWFRRSLKLCRESRSLLFPFLDLFQASFSHIYTLCSSQNNDTLRLRLNGINHHQKCKGFRRPCHFQQNSSTTVITGLRFLLFELWFDLFGEDLCYSDKTCSKIRSTASTEMILLLDGTDNVKLRRIFSLQWGLPQFFKALITFWTAVVIKIIYQKKIRCRQWKFSL